MSYKAKRQIREIKEAEKWAEYKYRLVFGFSGWLLFSCLVYFGAFLLFGGTVIN